jgi:hypothetical protein
LGRCGVLLGDEPPDGGDGHRTVSVEKAKVSDFDEASNAVNFITGFMQFLWLCRVYCQKTTVIDEESISSNPQQAS